MTVKMDNKTPETNIPAAKKTRPRKAAPYLVIHNANLFGWILSCFFVCGCMFFLGVMVGRNTAPVQFDVDRLFVKLGQLPASVLNPENTHLPETAEILPAAPIEMTEILDANDAIIDQLKDRQNPPEIYEQYIPPVLTPKYAKTPPPKEKSSPAPEPETKPASVPDVPKTEIAQVADVPAPEAPPKPAAKAEVPKPPPPSPPSPEPAKQVDSGSEFAIQVASVQDAEKARMLMARFREKGYPAYCQSSTVDGATWHRVRIGPYPDRTLAARDQERLKAAGVDSLVIAMHQITP